MRHLEKIAAPLLIVTLSLCWNNVSASISDYVENIQTATTPCSDAALQVTSCADVTITRPSTDTSPVCAIYSGTTYTKGTYQCAQNSSGDCKYCVPKLISGNEITCINEGARCGVNVQSLATAIEKKSEPS